MMKGRYESLRPSSILAPALFRSAWYANGSLEPQRSRFTIERKTRLKGRVHKGPLHLSGEGFGVEVRDLSQMPEGLLEKPPGAAAVGLGLVKRSGELDHAVDELALRAR